jgi:hypothetical protein
VIDQLLLRLEPLRPSRAAELVEGTASHIVLKRLEGHAIPILPAASAVQRCHGGKIDILQNVIQSMGVLLAIE